MRARAAACAAAPSSVAPSTTFSSGKMQAAHGSSPLQQQQQQHPQQQHPSDDQQPQRDQQPRKQPTAAGSADPPPPPQQQQQQPPDLRQPLVLAVGRMGPAYWQWVHKPVAGRARFFASDALEHLTRCPWWVVPLVWLPAAALLAARAVRWLRLPPAQLAALQLQGVLLWQALEYAIHRFLFHAQVDSYWGITAHFLLHGNHHKFPKDAHRLVFPPLPAAAIAAAIYGALRLLLAPPAASALMSGVLLGYVGYDCLHYGMHHAAWLPGGVLQELKVRHAHHHYQQSDTGYGISSVLFDALLGTRAPAL
jgi:sterol desaturase/sphingolipid hydroxylase (fatty acid hydroxylase superfamily)